MATRSGTGKAGKRAKQPTASAPATAATSPAPPGLSRPSDEEDIGELLRDLTLLTAANNLMAQTAFLTVERMRISTEVVDEAITQELGQQVFRQCEEMAEASSRLVVRLLDRVGAQGAEADAIRDLVAMRRAMGDRTQGTKEKPTERRRLLESMERMYG